MERKGNYGYIYIYISYAYLPERIQSGASVKWNLTTRNESSSQQDCLPATRYAPFLRSRANVEFSLLLVVRIARCGWSCVYPCVCVCGYFCVYVYVYVCVCVRVPKRAGDTRRASQLLFVAINRGACFEPRFTWCRVSGFLTSRPYVPPAYLAV